MKRTSRRDESLEHLLRESLQAPSQTPAAGLCPDAEVLAAWTDGALEDRELAMTRAHVAGCVSCQATLAVLARTAPPEATPLPWWQRMRSVRWLVPVAATATAIAIWVAVPREEYTRPAQETSLARESERPQSESLRSAAQSPVAVSREPADAASASPPPPAAAEFRVDAAQKAATEGQDAVSPAREQAAAAPSEPTANAAAGSLARQEVAAPRPAPPAATPQPVLAPTASRAAPVASPQLRDLGALQETVTVAQQAVIASPDTAFRWRIGRAGSVEYSADMGETWEARPTGVLADLLAGASPAGTVCWVVGRAGTVLLTTNGLDWRRVSSPTTMDVRTVEATDSRTATLTTANGQRFRTTDGGASWQGL